MIRGDHKFSDKDSCDGPYHFQDFRPTPSKGTSRRSVSPADALKNLRPRSRIRRCFRPLCSMNSDRAMRHNNTTDHYPRSVGREFVQELGLQGLAPDLPDLPGMLRSLLSQDLGCSHRSRKLP